MAPSALRWLDVTVIAVYMAAMAVIGIWFARRQTSTERYFVAQRSIPGWAMGISLFATIISSVTYIAYPGSAYGGNWAELVPGLMVLPVLILAAVVLIPFYRRVVGMSAYEYFGKRFGYGARAFSSLAFALGHFSKLGFVFYLVALTVHSMTGWDKVTVDAPITTALEQNFGGGRIERYSWPGRLENVGIENLRCESVFDAANPKDENHSWMAVTMENVQNAWVRQLTGVHFAGSLVTLWESCKWVSDYIAAAPAREPLPSSPGDAKRFEELALNIEPPNDVAPHPLVLTNGWLTCNGRLLIGGNTTVAWWRGNIRPSEAPGFGVGVTRFVPGRSGPGFTDDLEELANWMATNGLAALNHNYGLWYERRRDDHERVRRIDGDVFPPFYEMPFARTGQGTAWNGLSRYDLAKFNPWYWSRLREFADVCDQRGLLLFHQNYFQHNILEAGAHWADCPWRSANNINNIPQMQPWSAGPGTNRFALRQSGRQYLIYLGSGSSPEIDLTPETEKFIVHSINLHTGAVNTLVEPIETGKKVSLPKSSDSPLVLWLTRE
jgi:Family of unknown function (DUF6298)/Sodium:solute symporter family